MLLLHGKTLQLILFIIKLAYHAKNVFSSILKFIRLERNPALTTVALDYVLKTWQIISFVPLFLNGFEKHCIYM